MILDRPPTITIRRLSLFLKFNDVIQVSEVGIERKGLSLFLKFNDVILAQRDLHQLTRLSLFLKFNDVIHNVLANSITK